jgi:NADPH:quinone reductase-like Zn-dependent oxidoreductase
MQAVVYDHFGTPEVLQLREVAVPEPKADEVLVKVHAASVNSWDWDKLLGKPAMLRWMSFGKPQHAILGADIAGTVEDAGTSVTRLRPGDEVFGDISGCHWGGFAEYVCARADVLALKAPEMSFEQAAALPQAGVLALQGLRFGGEIQPGQHILFNGAGGGVGTLGIQIAKSYDAEVTGVDSAGKLEMLRSLGADHVVDYQQEDFTRSGRQYDLIVDVIGNKSVSDYRRALAPAGTYAMIGGRSATVAEVFLKGALTRTGRQRIGLVMHRPNIADLDRIAGLFVAGKLVPIIDTVYPLRQVQEGLRRIGAGDVKGKIIITMEDTP